MGILITWIRCGQNISVGGPNSSFQQLKKVTQFFATWDDHDFGRNDAGRHYPFKKESKEIFLSFY